VRVWTQEEPHVHAAHDSKVLIESGGGVLYLDGNPIILDPGSQIDIPRNVPHFFVHRARTPFTQARVTFYPPFDGKDRIPVSKIAENPVSWRTRAARGLETFFKIVTFRWSLSS
jgi:mannose-6-phosphate isomerase-like protein (cupin superfamily)